jgi:iron complex transport system substrate-binding protein
VISSFALPVRLVAVALLAVLFVGCSRAGERTGQDMNAQPIAAQTAQRIVSVSPSTTETLYALGAAPALVGRSAFCNYPPEATALPVVGDYARPSLEAIVALRPNLVVGEQGPVGAGLESALRMHGTVPVFPPTGSVSEVLTSFRILGAAVQRQQAAEELVRGVQQKLSRIQSLTGADGNAVRAVLVFDTAPLFVAGSKSFAGDVLVHAGYENVVAGTDVVGGAEAYPRWSIEQLIVNDPDIVFLTAATGMGGTEASHLVARVSALPGWNRLRAVLAQRVLLVTGDAVLRPGPRIADGVAQLNALGRETLRRAGEGK